MAIIKCPDCGKEISSNAEKCINCGCPIIKHENIHNKKAKKKTPILIAVLLLLALIVLFGIKQYKSYEYQQNINSVCYEIITSGAEAEECGNLVHDVWYNTIFEESSKDTDKYTKQNGRFNEDFNDSLDNLYNDKDFIKKISNIQSDQDNILNTIKGMKNPPSEYKDAYKSLLNLYEEYNDFTELAINPTGSLQSFTEDFNEKDESFVDSYNKMKMYME